MNVKSLGIAALVAGVVASAGASANEKVASAPQWGTGPVRVAQADYVRVPRADIISLYSGATARASDHAQTYHADGTWTNDSGQSGTWTVTGSGVLVMSGDLNLELEIYRNGNRFYHRNARTGAGGVYRLD